MRFQRPISLWWWLGGGTIVAGLFVVSVFPGHMHAATATQEWRERTVRRLPVERNEPLAIRKVKVKGESAFSNRKFLSDEDWLIGLTIQIRNRSKQAILLAAIQLQFPRPSGSDGRILIDDIYYGNRALLRRPPTTADLSAGIAPGQTADIQLPATELEAIRMALAGTGYPSSIEKVNLRISSVIFEDDTMWGGGSHFKRDHNDPRTWVDPEPPLAKAGSAPTSEPTKSPLRNGTTFGPQTNQRFRTSDWSFSNPSPSPLQRLFSHASYRTASPPQSGCFRYLPPTYPSCDVVGHTCTYRKARVTSESGGYYLGACSALCSGDCGWHDSQVENPCSPGGGGAGGGGEGGGGGGYDGNGSCYTDSDCDFGYYCGDGFMCTEDEFLN